MGPKAKSKQQKQKSMASYLQKQIQQKNNKLKNSDKDIQNKSLNIKRTIKNIEQDKNKNKIKEKLDDSKIKGRKQVKKSEESENDNDNEHTSNEEEEQDEQTSKNSSENENDGENSDQLEENSEEEEESSDDDNNSNNNSNNSEQNQQRQKRSAVKKIKSYKKLKNLQYKDEIDIDEEELNGVDDMNEINGNQNDNSKLINSKSYNQEMQADEEEILDKFPKNLRALEKMLEKVNERLDHYKEKYFEEWEHAQNNKSNVGDNAVPICADIRTFDWQFLKDQQMKHGGKMFDVIMMDPPWQLSTSQPSRGVAIAYDSLVDDIIQSMPIQTLQNDGFIFIWAINAKYRISVKIMEQWGYKLIDEIAWVKKTVNGKIAKGHGFYLQHAKESCLIGVKGNVDIERFKKNIASDIIFSERRGQSQKPEEIYEYAEQLVPNGFYLEVFGRRNNLRSNWITIGNEL